MSFLSVSHLVDICLFIKNRHKGLDVINVCCYFCLILLFTLAHFLSNGCSRQTNMAFIPLSYLRCKRSFGSDTFLFVVDLYAKKYG